MSEPAGGSPRLLSHAYARMTPDAAQRAAAAAHLDQAWLDRERRVILEAGLPQQQPSYSKGRIPYTAIPFALRVQLNRVRISLLRARNRHEVFPADPVDLSIDQERVTAWKAAAAAAGAEVTLTPSRDVVLTHDLDEAYGMPGVEQLRRVEREVGAGSALGVLSERYRADPRMLEHLVAEGCEVFSHGYLHDGTDAYLEPDEILRRLRHFFEVYPSMRGHVRGYRSGQLVRSERLYDAIAEVFDYDMTPPNVELGGPHGWRQGCATTYPFTRPSGLVQLPLTLPQDYFMAFIDRMSPSRIARVWIDVTERVWAAGGVAVHLIHPDNVVRKPGLLRAYEEYLQAMAAAGARFRLPSELANEVREASRTSA
jgi:peptidoglycan/xylan/chitin deacetylase (PgdA/CDA1 family)